MGVGATNRIVDVKFAIDEQVSQYQRNKRVSAYKKKIWKYRNLKGQLVLCSQCKEYMDSNIAKQQIENKRENAPICVACILGIPRKNKKQNNELEQTKKSRMSYLR